MTERFILTTKDLTILEVMHDRAEGDDALRRLLVRKIARAVVMLRGDVPPGVATLSSRVTFRVGAAETDTRVITHAPMTPPVGMFLPITTRRGLALLGLVEGQSIAIDADAGREETLTLETVHYQPEAARNERIAREALARPEQRRAALRVIPGALSAGRLAATAGDFDEPGPGAA